MSKSPVLPGRKTDQAVAEVLGSIFKWEQENGVNFAWYNLPDGFEIRVRTNGDHELNDGNFQPSRDLSAALIAHADHWRWVFEEEVFKSAKCLNIDLWVRRPPFERGVSVLVRWTEVEDRQGAYALGICRAVLTAKRVGII